MMAKETNNKIFKRVKLPYELNSLGSYISREIMDDHYNGNHKLYEDNLNKIWQDLQEILGKQASEGVNVQITTDLIVVLQNLQKLPIPDQMKEKIRFNAGGLINHNLFFLHLSLNKNSVSEKFLIALWQSGFDKSAPLEDLKSKLIQQSLDPTIDGVVYGSSYWTWLVVDKNQKMKIIKTPRQDSPWMQNLKPLIGIDMWEHAYIKQYGISKEKYLDALVNYCLNWDFISYLYFQNELGHATPDIDEIKGVFPSNKSIESSSEREKKTAFDSECDSGYGSESDDESKNRK